MDIKELEDIVSQLSSEVSKTSTNFNSFRSEAKKNDDDLFNISRDVYSTLKSNKNSISSIEEDVQEIKDNSLLIRNSFGELKNKQETIQFNLNSNGSDVLSGKMVYLFKSILKFSNTLLNFS